MKKQISVWLAPSIYAKLVVLVREYGTITMTIAFAIEALYREYIASKQN